MQNIKFVLLFLLIASGSSSFAIGNNAVLDSNFAIELYYPKNDTLLKTNASIFKWQKVYNATSYHFQLSNDSLFKNIIQEDTNLVDLVLLINGLDWNKRYFWRMKAKKGSDTISTWSAVAKFRIISEVPEKLILQIPGNNIRNMDFNPTYFQWKALDEATLYWITLYEGDFKEENKKRFFSQQYFYSATTKINKKYYWCVSAFDYKGNLIDSTEFSTFSTTDSIAAPVITNIDTIVSLPFTLAWTTTPLAQSHIMRISQKKDMSDSIFQSEGIKTLTYIVSNLKNGEYYYAGIRIKNEDVYSNWSIYKFKTNGLSAIETEETNSEIIEQTIYSIAGILQLPDQNILPNGMYFKVLRYANGRTTSKTFIISK